MIAGLEGTLESRGPDHIVLKVGGVSFRVFVPSSTLSDLGNTGARVKLHTYLQVREDALTLYGFLSLDELRLFETLLTVSGVGPRGALSMLSALKPDDLALAIASGNIDLLTTVPGIGKKTASRLVLELKGKLEREWAMSPTVGSAGGNAEVVAALTALGYTVAEAFQAVSTLPSSDLPLEEKVRLALQGMGKR